MNMMKKNGGFTLVELIVVIAILAILAGIAVPAYSGYIAKANEASDVTQLDAIKTAAVFATVDKVNNANVNKIIVESGNSKVDVTYTEGTDTTDKTLNDLDISAYCTVPTFKSDKYKTNGATWTSDGWGATASGS